MTDLLLDDDRDLAYVDGDLVTVTGLDELLQSVQIALLTRLGEYFLDTDAGLAWGTVIFVRPAEESLIRAEIIRVCGSVDGVEEVNDVVIETNEITREATIDVLLRTVYGDGVVTL